MTFDAAIKAHSDWKLRLANYCQGKPTEPIDIRKLAMDNVCELGKWLHGEGRKYATDPVYPELVQGHATFHRTAAKLASMVERGEASTALTQIQSRDSEFGALSVRLVGILMGFRTRYPNG
jgi:hypothetical protein